MENEIYWKNRLGLEFEIINVTLKPDAYMEDAGFTLSRLLYS